MTRVALSEQAAPPGDAEVVARVETPEPAAPGDATDCRDRLPLGARAAQCSAVSARDPEARVAMHRFFAPTEQTTPEDLETCEQSLRSFAPDWQQFVWVYDITRAMLEWRHIEGVTFAPAQALVHKRLHDAWRAGKVPTQVLKHFISLTALRDYGWWWVDDDVMWTGNRCPGGHDCLLITDRCNPTDLLNLANPERDPDGCPQWINMSVMRMETNSPIAVESLKTMWDSWKPRALHGPANASEHTSGENQNILMEVARAAWRAGGSVKIHDWCAAFPLSRSLKGSVDEANHRIVERAYFVDIWSKYWSADLRRAVVRIVIHKRRSMGGDALEQRHRLVAYRQIVMSVLSGYLPTLEFFTGSSVALSVLSRAVNMLHSHTYEHVVARAALRMADDPKPLAGGLFLSGGRISWRRGRALYRRSYLHVASGRCSKYISVLIRTPSTGWTSVSLKRLRALSQNNKTCHCIFPVPYYI